VISTRRPPILTIEQSNFYSACPTMLTTMPWGISDRELLVRRRVFAGPQTHRFPFVYNRRPWGGA
jgi:hypothetical protein